MLGVLAAASSDPQALLAAPPAAVDPVAMSVPLPFPADADGLPGPCPAAALLFGCAEVATAVAGLPLLLFDTADPSAAAVAAVAAAASAAALCMMSSTKGVVPTSCRRNGCSHSSPPEHRYSSTLYSCGLTLMPAARAWLYAATPAAGFLVLAAV